MNHFFGSESHDCKPPALLIIECSLVQSAHINWPGGEKRAAFPFQPYIVLSGNVYLDVNQPAKVLYPESVWRVGPLALHGGNWLEEIGTLGMSKTECHVAVWVTSLFLSEFSIKVGAFWLLHFLNCSQHLQALGCMVLLWLHLLFYYCRQPQSLYWLVLRLKMFGNLLDFLAALSVDFHPAFIKRSNLDEIKTCTFPVKLIEDWKGGNEEPRGGNCSCGRLLRTMIRGMRNMIERTGCGVYCGQNCHHINHCCCTEKLMTTGEIKHLGHCFCIIIYFGWKKHIWLKIVKILM